MMFGFEIEKWRFEGMTSRLQESWGVVGACPTCGYYLFKEPWPPQFEVGAGYCLACEVFAGQIKQGLKELHEINGDHHGG